MTYYTVFVIDLASRRVQIVGSTPSPNDLFMRQVGRTLTAADDGNLVGHRVLICDRDAKWSAPVCKRLGEAGIRVVQTPYQAPNAKADAERFVRSIKHECLSRMIRSANVISAGQSPSSSSITAVSGIIKALRLRSRGVMTRDRRFRCLGSLVRHYAIPSCRSRCP